MGPPIHTWAMRYEAKHKTLINFSSISKNYINICYTIAKRHPTHSALIMEKMEFKNKFIFRKLEKINIENSHQIFSSFFADRGSELIYSVKCLTVYFGYHYRNELMVKMSAEGGYGLIKQVLLYQNDIYFFIQYFNTLQFTIKLNSTEVTETEEFNIIKYKNLEFKKPKELVLVNNKKYIIREALYE